MDYTNLRNTIRGMQDEIIGGIQDCIRIDSVGGEPEEGAPYVRTRSEKGTGVCVASGENSWISHGKCG